MSYEVYIDIRHHPRHLDDWERKLSTADRWSEPADSDPSDAERMRAVCNSLRAMADEYDPDVLCTHCGALRHKHAGYPARLVHCFNRYGPATQAAWWGRPRPRATSDGTESSDFIGPYGLGSRMYE